MGLFSKSIKTMDELFLHVLQDIYYAENQIVKALPDMIEKATNRELTAGFKSHLAETENQISRLEQAFELLGEKPKSPNARQSTGSSMEPRRSREKSTTRRCSMPRSWLRAKPWSITRSHATAR